MALLDHVHSPINQADKFLNLKAAANAFKGGGEDHIGEGLRLTTWQALQERSIGFWQLSV